MISTVPESSTTTPPQERNFSKGTRPYRKKIIGIKGNPKFTDAFIEAEAQALLDYIPIATPIPFIKDFCFKRGYPSIHITTDFIKNKIFLNSLLKFKDAQETAIVYGVLKKQFEGYFAIHLLKNVAPEWREIDKVQSDLKITNVVLVRANAEGLGEAVKVIKEQSKDVVTIDSTSESTAKVIRAKTDA